MDEDTYAQLKLGTPHEEKEPPSGMFNLNKGVALSFEDPGGFDKEYEPHPESLVLADGAARGTLIEHKGWSDSTVYPGTTRDWYVYVPAQYDPATPAALWVGMDAFGSSEEGRTTLDNLIHKGDMPVTIGVFVTPGSNPDNAEQRSLEYDTVSDVFASFLETEILPLVSAEYNISSDPQLRMAAGGSSGGICAFTLAFLRPDLFGKVLCFIGSFVNIRGGHNLSWIVRNTPRKPITVYLADGDHDLNNQVRKRISFARHSILKMIIQPRQARDKHRKRALRIRDLAVSYSTAAGRSRIEKCTLRCPTPATPPTSSGARAAIRGGILRACCLMRCGGCGARLRTRPAKRWPSRSSD